MENHKGYTCVAYSIEMNTTDLSYLGIWDKMILTGKL